MKAEPIFLIVDDDSNSRYLTRHALQEAFPGCRVVESATSNEALTRVATGCPNAVLMEHRFGPDDGIDLIACIRATSVDCLVILLTGNTDPSIHARALTAGADGVFRNWEIEYVDYLRRTLCVGG